MLAETLGGLAFALHTLPDLERRLQAIEEWDRLYDEIGTVRHLDDTRYWPKARLAQVQLEAGDPRFAQTGEVALRCAEAEPYTLSYKPDACTASTVPRTIGGAFLASLAIRAGMPSARAMAI